MDQTMGNEPVTPTDKPFQPDVKPPVEPAVTAPQIPVQPTPATAPVKKEAPAVANTAPAETPAEQPAQAETTDKADAEKPTDAEAADTGLEAVEIEEMKQKYSLPVEAEAETGKRSWKLPMTTPIKIGLGVLLVAVLGIIMLWTRHSDPVEETPVSEQEIVTPAESTLGVALTLAEGTVEISDKQESINDATFSKLTTDTEFGAGQFVRTAADSRAILTLDDGSAIRLNNDTTLFLSTLTTTEVTVILGDGEVYTRVVNNTERQFTVQTTNDSFTALGTAYKTISRDGVEGVQTFQSSVTTQDKTSVQEGNEYYVENTDDKAKEGKATKLSLESVKSDEFVVWNRDKDASSSEFKDSLGFLKDFEAPKLESIKPTASTTEAETITVSGKTDSDATITINGEAVAVSTQDGSFSTSLALSIGENKITIIATDEAGNTTKKVLSITRKEVVEEPEESAIVLVGETGTTGIDLSWTLPDNLEAGDGFKVVYSDENAAPIYGEDSSQFTDDAGTVLPKKDGKQYNIRVCIYDAENNKCENYSNAVKVTAPTE